MSNTYGYKGIFLFVLHEKRLRISFVKKPNSFPQKQQWGINVMFKAIYMQNWRNRLIKPNYDTYSVRLMPKIAHLHRRPLIGVFFSYHLFSELVLPRIQYTTR